MTDIQIRVNVNCCSPELTAEWADEDLSDGLVSRGRELFLEVVGKDVVFVHGTMWCRTTDDSWLPLRNDRACQVFLDVMARYIGHKVDELGGPSRSDPDVDTLTAFYKRLVDHVDMYLMEFLPVDSDPGEPRFAVVK